MFRYLCPHRADVHASSFQRPPARWAAEPDATHTDECPRTGRLVVYHLREVVFGEAEG